MPCMGVGMCPLSKGFTEPRSGKSSVSLPLPAPPPFSSNHKKCQNAGVATGNLWALHLFSYLSLQPVKYNKMKLAQGTNVQTNSVL